MVSRRRTCCPQRVIVVHQYLSIANQCSRTRDARLVPAARNGGRWRGEKEEVGGCDGWWGYPVTYASRHKELQETNTKAHVPSCDPPDPPSCNPTSSTLIHQGAHRFSVRRDTLTDWPQWAGTRRKRPASHLTKGALSMKYLATPPLLWAALSQFAISASATYLG